MIVIPEKLMPYVDFEEGEILAVNLPEELKDDFEALKKAYKASKDAELTDF